MAQASYGLEGAGVETIYFGGGTPSILSKEQWNRFCDLIHARVDLTSDVEWSVECNPDSYDRLAALLLCSRGCNRIVIGVQSLDDKELKFLGRAHDADTALGVLGDSQLKSFRSVCVDIMYGLPEQSLKKLEATLRRVLDFDIVSHLSAYELTLHPGTPLYEKRRELNMPDDSKVYDMAQMVREIACEYGLEQYEISNFARDGHRCRHNMAYWKHEPYLGLGPSAHSYFPFERMANVCDVSRYIDQTAAGNLPLDFKERLGPEEIGTEMIFLGLRSLEGINEKRFKHMTGNVFACKKRKEKLDDFLHEGFLNYEPPFWRPTDKGIMMADAMAGQLV